MIMTEEEMDEQLELMEGMRNQEYCEKCGFIKEQCECQEEEQNNNGWIPCSKELPPQPEENPIFENKPIELYLVSVKYADYPIRAFWNGKSFSDGFSRIDAVAWQPLPAPYQPKGE